MARGRMLLKTICGSEKLHNLSSDTARLFYTWLLSHLDQNGCHRANPMLLKSTVFPLREDVTRATIEGIIEELQGDGLIFLYGGGKYLCYPDFEEKQPYLRKDREGDVEVPTPTEEERRTYSDKMTELVGSKSDKMTAQGKIREGKIRKGKIREVLGGKKQDNDNPPKKTKKPPPKKTQTFPNDDYKKIETAYQEIRGHQELTGEDVKRLRHTSKQLFMDKITVSDILGCMKALEDNKEDWSKLWKPETISKMMSDYKAGRLNGKRGKKGEEEDESYYDVT